MSVCFVRKKTQPTPFLKGKPMLRQSLIVFLTFVAVSFVVIPQVSAATFTGDNPVLLTCSQCGQKYTKGTRHVCPPKPQPPKPKITCPKCKQTYTEGTRHVCPPKPQPPKPKITCPKCKQQYSANSVHVCPVDIGTMLGEIVVNATAWVNCKNCGERVRQDQMRWHRCPRPPVIIEGPGFQQPEQRIITCRNCGTRYYEGTRHVCPQVVQPTQPSPQVTVGNALPPPKPTVGNGNSQSIKPAHFDQQNIQAIQESILDPLKDTQIEKIEAKMPSDQDISDKIDNFNPPLTQQEKDNLEQAIKDGDVDKVKDILNNSGAGITGEDMATLTGLAGINDIINQHESGGTISQTDIKNTLDIIKDGDQTLLGGLTGDIQTLGKLNKIGKLLDIASTILSNGNTLAGTNIPTGIVPIAVFPDLPYGVVFPLGNGVYGVGTGGMGNIGIYQGYIPQPPIYGGGSVGTWNVGQGISIVLSNESGNDIKWRFSNGGEVFTLENGSFCNANPTSRQVSLQSSNGRWTSFNVNSGAYEVVKATNGTLQLQAQKTEVTIKSPGNPIPFNLFIGGEKYVIEPGKSLTLNDPKGDNSVYEIQFARSSDKEDVAVNVVGGQRTFYIGRDQSDKKWSLFPEWAEQVKPAPPRQNSTVASSTITYDDAPITASNVGGLPVLPSYDY